jgi:hypothetical protein
MASTTPATPLGDDGIPLDEPVVAATVAAAPPICSDDWSTRQRAREIDRKLRRPMHFNPSIGSSATSALQGPRRFDPPQNLFDQLEQVTTPTIATATPPVTSAKQLIKRRTSASQVVAWLVVSLGTIVLAAGLGLIGWSLYAEQMQYWNLALGLSLGGQGALIFGLVLVVSRLWRNSRYAVNKLQDVHARLGQLQTTADALTATRPGGAPAFYGELAHGASPQMLLSNLKGQLDQLATRLGN